MQILFAFEQLIINTEDPNGSVYGEEFDNDQEREQLIKIKQQLDQEQDPYLKNQLLELYEQPLMLMGLRDNKIETEAYFENVDDIINEEDIEESVILNQS